MGNNKFELNLGVEESEDIFSTNIHESTEPELNENLPGANLPPIDDSKKNADEASIPIPQTTEISVDAYNSIIDELQKTFKEAAEVVNMLQKVRPVEEYVSIDDQQEMFTDIMIENAMFESYYEGPYFESVKNPDKKKIKDAVKAIIKAAPKTKDDEYSLRAFNTLVKDIATKAAVVSIGTGIGAAIGSALTYAMFPGKGTIIASAKASASVIPAMGAYGATVGGVINITNKMYVKSLRENKDFTTKLWQMVGVFNVDDSKLSDALKHYSELFKDQLGELTLNAAKLKIGGSKQTGSCYLLIVDSKKEKIDDIILNIETDKKDGDDAK